MVTKPYTLADLKAKCKKLHIEFEDADGYFSIYSPPNYRFAVNNGHVCVSDYRINDRKEKAVQRLMNDIGMGLEKCSKNCKCKE